ncbi:hypothetical protein BJF90_22050 [Pseudonocardia sp. CNS-004]|nr:hypothetical protein BJF90_22050 [Pseudonocardia sp. CNS-004]
MRFEAGGRRLVVKHPDSHDVLITSVTTGAAYRVSGVPASRTWAAVALEDLRTEDGLLIKAGEVLEVGDHVEGAFPDLEAPGNGHLRDELAGRFAIGALLGDWGGFHWVNLLRGEQGPIHHVDFDEGLHSRLGQVDPFVWMLRRHPEIFGRLTTGDVLDQFAHLLAQRDRLLAVLPGDELLLVVTERLDRVAEAVATRPPPPPSGRTHWPPRATSWRSGSPVTGAGRRVRPADAARRARDRCLRALGRVRVVTTAQLRRLVAEGRDVWLHTAQTGRRWQVTVSGGPASRRLRPGPAGHARGDPGGRRPARRPHQHHG